MLATYPPHIELQVGWIADLFDHMREGGHTRVEADAAAQADWGRQVEEASQGSMFRAPTCNSWYNGGNIEGKARVFPIYLGGLDRFMARAEEMAANGYEGFVIDGQVGSSAAG